MKPNAQTPSDIAHPPSYKNEVLSAPARPRHERLPAAVVAEVNLPFARLQLQNKSETPQLHRNVDTRKIQSNNKDIDVESGSNFVAERRQHIVPTSLPTQRSTMANVYSNAGGNGMHLDSEDVDFLHAQGVQRRRHRRGPKHR